uniref:Pollen allergen Phl p 11 n=1 Tax=Oryza punctata TaxID=4537 RepID=A0A0E0LCL7_ORYPU
MATSATNPHLLPSAIPRPRERSHRSDETTMTRAPLATTAPLLVLAVLAAAAAATAPPAPGGNKDPGGFVVTGRVYCDPCRAGFETNVSKSIPGSTVSVECRHYGAGRESLKAEATTDEKGWYKVEIDQDHQEEICEVVLDKSGDPACSETEQSRDRSRVPLTSNNGLKQNGIRYANPIAFFRKEPLADCGSILQKYDLKDAPETP